MIVECVKWWINRVCRWWLILRPKPDIDCICTCAGSTQWKCKLSMGTIQPNIAKILPICFFFFLTAFKADFWPLRGTNLIPGKNVNMQQFTAANMLIRETWSLPGLCSRMTFICLNETFLHILFWLNVPENKWNTFSVNIFLFIFLIMFRLNIIGQNYISLMYFMLRISCI